MWIDLEKEFPHWQKNPYYRQLLGIRGRFKYFLVSHFPQYVFAILHAIYYVKSITTKFRNFLRLRENEAV